jgi:transcriptional repressor NrdR
MRCPVCGHESSRVIDSRTTGDAIRRRRVCSECEHRFTTHERVELRLPWVVKKDGAREPYSRDKVRRGIALACRKRSIDAETLEQAVRHVEQRLIALRLPEVQSGRVGEAVMQTLRETDAVAYVRFASVYREFESIDEFADAISPLQDDP